MESTSRVESIDADGDATDQQAYAFQETVERGSEERQRAHNLLEVENGLKGLVSMMMP
jgi:hypothetical protein